jgi:4-hydroxybenzoate polyprenyltransferase
VVAAVALVAGGAPLTAFQLGLSMVSLQFAIGALNDIVDAPADAGRVPPKPIPSGAVGLPLARVVVAIGAGVGLVLAATAGFQVVVLAVAVLVVGTVYDLVAKGTPWSWLPYAIGIPLLPVYGWVGARGSLPGFFGALVPMAVLAGAALAVANARVDMEMDRAAGTRSVATALGADRSWWAGAALFTAATLVGVWFTRGTTWAWPAAALVIIGTGLVGAGVALGRGGGPAARRRAWEAQAIGAAIAAAGWVAGMLPGP